MRNIFAFGSPSFRKLGRSADDLTDKELAELILSEPRFLRRPLIVTEDGRVLTGSRAAADA